MRRASKISLGLRSESVNVLSSGQYLVIPGMNFTCSGAITSFLLGVDVRTQRNGRDQYVSIDTWRPEREFGELNYIHNSTQNITLAARDFSSDGVLQFNLTTPLVFQSGDVLGVYQPPHERSVVRLFYTTQLIPPVGYNVFLPSFNTAFINSTDQLGQSFNGFLLLRPVTSKNIK